MLKFITECWQQDKTRRNLWFPVLLGIGIAIYFSLNIEPSKAVSVMVSSAYNYKLTNELDASKTIAYNLYGTEDIKFLSGDFGKSFDLSVSVEDDQWQQAASGKHSDLLTFTVEYVDA